MRPFRYRPSYTMPGVDSPRAKAAAQMLLVGARSIDRLSAEGFARQQRLKVETAELMLRQERQRRARA